MTLQHPLGPGHDLALGVRAGVVGELFVADEAVEPVVRDADLKPVVAGAFAVPTFPMGGGIASVRRLMTIRQDSQMISTATALGIRERHTDR